MATKEFLQLDEDETPETTLKYKIATYVLGACTLILFVIACVLGGMLGNQDHQQSGKAHHNTPANPKPEPAVIPIPERLYYCNDAQVNASGICTQLPFGSTPGSFYPSFSLDECNLVCGGRGQGKSGGNLLASLWPLPTSRYSLQSTLIAR